MKRFLFLVVALSIVILPVPSAWAGPLYTFKDLGTLGGAYSYPFSVNNLGQVAGASYLTFGPNASNHAFLSGIAGGPLQDLGTLPGGSNSGGLGVNDLGQVIGEGDENTGGTKVISHAFVYDPSDGLLHDIGPKDDSQPIGLGVIGYSLNSLGQVVWVTAQNDAVVQTLTNLGVSGSYNAIQGVNHLGQAVGAFTPIPVSVPAPIGAIRAFFYSNGVLNDLNDDLINPISGIILTNALAISDTGYIAGSYTITTPASPGVYYQRAFLLTPVDGLGPLPTPGPGYPLDGYVPPTNYPPAPLPIPTPEPSTIISAGIAIVVGAGALLRRRRVV